MPKVSEPPFLDLKTKDLTASLAHELSAMKLRSRHWLDWRWQLANQALVTQALTICYQRSVALAAESLGPEGTQFLHRFPALATPFYLSLAKELTATDPVFRQVLPTIEEQIPDRDDAADPIGDTQHAVITTSRPILIHRHADRALLLTTGRCPIHCRHCFRRNLGRDGDELDANLLDSVVQYVRAHGEITEVILTGGDPLMLSDRLLNQVLTGLARLPQLASIRIHTRMLVANPFRVSRPLLRTLAEMPKPVWFVTHCNHESEVSPELGQAVRLLLKAGVVTLNQSVLLRGINDTVECMNGLCQKLIATRIKPYYLHHCDRASGNAHFRTTLGTGLTLKRALQGTLPGYAVPTYVLDIPGGKGKIPIDHCYYSQDESGYVVEAVDGTRHFYRDYPCETGFNQ